MIPKLIIQTSIQKPPEYIKKSFLNILPDYNYKHFNDIDIIQFFQQNIIEEFPDVIQVFLSIKNGAHKADFFRYYYLYIYGGIYVDSDAMIINNLDDFVNNYNFFTVKSCLNNDSIFNGFIGCTKNHPIIYNALQHIYYINKDELNNNYFIVCKKLKNIIDDYNKKNEIIILKEKTQNNFNDGIYISTYFEDKEILKHYYNKDAVIESNIPLEKSNNSNNIGITLNIPDHLGNIFSNGLNQNSIYLGELLVNIGYNVYFILNACIDDKNKKIINELLYHKNFKYITLSDIYTIEYDIIFFLSFSYNLNLNRTLRYIGTKCVYYDCGNIYLTDGEKMLYNKGNSINNYNKNLQFMYDEIWVIPQMINTNLHYLKILYRTKTIGVPFIWSDKAIEFSAKVSNVKNIDELLYKKRNFNKIAIFEPNLSLMKWCMPALLICENAYRIEKNIDHVFLNNTQNHDNLQLNEVQKIINSLDLHSDRKISSESRFNTLDFMKNHATHAVSFQMENPLNYLYFDLAWMGHPVIHNAYLIKDVGYYYNGFNYDEGAIMLNHSLKNHDFDSYIKKNREVISKYLPSNTDLQNKYKILIQNLLNN